MKLTEPEKKILEELIRDVTQTLSNRSCNDFDLSQFMSKEEIDGFVKEWMVWSNCELEFEPGDNRYTLPDFTILHFLIDKLLEE